MGYRIDKVSWHTQQLGEPEPLEEIAAQFWGAVHFLQQNGLTTQQLANSIDDIDDEFEIHTDHLTPEGIALMRAAYERWVRKVERGMSPDDTKILQKALARIRESATS